MKKLAFYIAVGFFAAPIAVFAAGFDRDLYYGIADDRDVTRLQEFLKSQSVYSGPVTGNFFSLTRGGVKRFQEREGIAPALGYFGPKTRTRANEILSQSTDGSSVRITELESLISSLNSVQTNYPSSSLTDLIKKYQGELSLLKGSETVLPPPVVEPPSPSVPPETATTTPPVEKKKEEFKISGGSESVFPIAAVNPTKIGDITIQNNLSASILLSQIMIKLTDQMNSASNRGREVIFILRDGVTTSDEVISSTRYTFNSTVPPEGNPHVSIFGISIPKTFPAGAARTYGLWVDNLDYVISGSLAITFDSVQATIPISPVGGFTFVLNRP